MVGIALAGGGAKGAYQIGAYQALINNGIKPSIVAGTSIGSVNAVFMAQGDIDKLTELWLNTDSDIFGIDSGLTNAIANKKFTSDDLKLGFNNVKKILSNKGIDTSKFLNVISKEIDEDKLRNSKIKFGLITVKIDDKKIIPLKVMINDIPKGKVAEYVLASCYWPLFNYQKIIDDKYYLDGGFYNNIPLDLVESYGCDTIYAIRIKGIGFDRNKLEHDTKVIEIKPSKSLGSILLFNKETNKRNMTMGYLDALKVIQNLDGYKFYFKPRSIKYYDRIVRKIKTNTLTRAKILFKAKNNKELVIKLVEYLLIKNNVEDLKVYKIKREIKYLKKHNTYKDKFLTTFINSCK